MIVATKGDCKCKNPEQDKLYGKGKRAFVKKDAGKWICSSCKKGMKE